MWEAERVRSSVRAGHGVEDLHETRGQAGDEVVLGVPTMPGASP
jgi:hypothetical protein